MKKPLQIGITGGIGSGKSLISKVFHSLGAPVYDADSRAKNLMTTDGILISQIKKEFGTLSYLDDGILNRAYISKQVFVDAKRLARLNSLVHPRVAFDYSNWMGEQHYPYVLKEAALLFEADSYKMLDKIIVVYASEGLRIKRVMSRDKHRTEEQILDIIHSQLPDEEKMNKADFVIMNDEKSLVIPQVLKLHNEFYSHNDR